MQAGNCSANMQGDGNFVVYNNKTVVWKSNTPNKSKAPYTLIMQSDGNLVAYGSGTPRVVWASNTDKKGTGPYLAEITDACKLVVIDSKGTRTWSS